MVERGGRPIIALSGITGSGASMAVAYLAKEYGFTPLNMATPAERMLQAGFGIDPAIFTTDAQREPLEGLPEGSTPIGLRNGLLHAWGRSTVHGSLWAKAWGLMVDSSAAERIVVKDADYPSEARAVRDRGGVIWRIHRPGLEPTRESDQYRLRIEPDRTIINRGVDAPTLYRLLDVALADLERSL